MAALSLSAVGGLGREGCVALSANHLLALVGSGEGSQRGLNGNGTSTAASESKDKMKSRLLLDVIVRESSSVLELLAGEDQSLLIRGNALLVLDLSLDILDGVRGLNVEGNRLTSQSLYENLHIFFYLIIK